MLLHHILAKIDFLDETVVSLTSEIDERLAPFEPLLRTLDTIPGITRAAATTIVVETGADMSRFPSAGHLCSWAGLCPGHNESAGKRHSGQTRDGNRYLRGTLVQAALAAMRKKGSFLQAKYHRVKRHRGHKKAVIAVSHQLFEIAYYLMRDGDAYTELGGEYVDRRRTDHAIRRHVRQLEALGYRVTLDAVA